ncbi:MAG: flagellar biosynthetic protein FliO [Alphaproteobacteria bacterium]
MALGDYFQFVFALAFVLALILAAAWALRRFGRGAVRAPRRGSPHRRRLGIVEAIALDTRRKLVLVRRDDREHLLIIGPQSETVVETGILPEPADLADREPADLAEDGPAARCARATGRKAEHGEPTSFLRLVRQSVRTQS